MGIHHLLLPVLCLLGLWPATVGAAQGGTQPVLPAFTADEAENLKLLDEE